MKIIDRYLLKFFLGTFVSVFVIIFLIFILQSIWLFIGELAGKDLDLAMVLQFLAFSMPRIVPLVLPLSILLASIMTFGNLAENYEFASMKSAGMSLLRTIRPLFGFIIIIGILSFFFANSVIPYAEYKFINFRVNLAQSKPALAITEKQFNEIGQYNIKVEKKYGENDRFLKDVIIHKKSNLGYGNKTVIKAKNGELISNEGSNSLKLVLNEGNYYEDLTPQKHENRKKLPFAKSNFKKYTINIDLSQLDQGTNSRIATTNTMLNFNELRYTLDSLNKNFKKEITSFSENNTLKIEIPRKNSIYKTKKDSVSKNLKQKKVVFKKMLEKYSTEEKLAVLQNADSYIENKKSSLNAMSNFLNAKAKNINGHELALYDKFVIVYSCFLMFFIGAPLGAIIRKGGIGLPIVFAVAIFITFHFTNIFGRKMAEENGITTFFGAWISSIIFTPLALLLTYNSTKDLGFINTDAITTFFQKISGKIKFLQKTKKQKNAL